MMKRLLLTILCLCIALPASAQEVDFSRPLITDVSIRDIQIHSSFTGSRILFFGARNAPGDIIIAIHGPEMAATIRRKDQVGGVWMVVEQAKYDSVPGFYRHASTQPLRSILTKEGYDNLSLGNKGLLHRIREANPKTGNNLDNALLEQLKKRGWISTTPNEVQYFGDALFKATIALPDNTPKGNYLAEVILVHQGKVVSSQTISIVAEKIGVDAWLSKRAHEQPWAYGFAAVLLALVGGWLGNRMLGR